MMFTQLMLSVSVQRAVMIVIVMTKVIYRDVRHYHVFGILFNFFSYVFVFR